MASSFPIILAHGIAPFDRIMGPFSSADNSDDDRFHYYRKIRSSLLKRGFVVFHGRVSWAASLERRAFDLYRVILQITRNFTKWPRVHIIAHSMGGLDSRLMIYRYRLEERVASLTTIGTPHLGSSYADWGITRFGFLIRLLRPCGLNLSGFRDLTRKNCSVLNRLLEHFENTNGVVYQTVAGVQPLERIFLPLRASYRIIYREEGENDGLVSLRSAAWKESYFRERIDADHFNQIGWWDRGEAAAGIDRKTFEKNIINFYVKLATDLYRQFPHA
ncbi:MAG: hypothetical protein JRH06_13625 [Deltaproteobacteria bacterium]|nr:hypothetical protein [Deltaproteobacteria bacterium]MBW2138582.1 hypothetical protein [Deltaproteobacteria bacterium]